jgi:peptidoglycan/LPS O-acetylase OafA/YrhL
VPRGIQDRARAESHPRIFEIDGIRGWAALSVLLFHFFATCLGHRIPWLKGSFLRWSMDGPLAVLVFFVLSGDALATTFLAMGGKGRVRLVLGRWPRLVFPIAVSSLAVFLLVKAGWIFAGPAAKILRVEDWLGGFLAFHQDWSGLARYCLIDVFRPPAQSLGYNPFLWSMGVELRGSFLVFLELSLFRRLPFQRHLLLLSGLTALLALKGSYLCLFPPGILLSLLRSSGRLLEWRSTELGKWSGWVLSVSVLLWIALVDLPLDTFWGVLAAPAFVLGVYSNSALLGFFRCRISRFLGRISFSLFVLQFPVLVSMASFLFVFAASKGSAGETTLLAISCASCLATGILAWGLAFLDESFQRRLRRFLEWGLAPG